SPAARRPRVRARRDRVERADRRPGAHRDERDDDTVCAVTRAFVRRTRYSYVMGQWSASAANALLGSRVSAPTPVQWLRGGPCVLWLILLSLSVACSSATSHEDGAPPRCAKPALTPTIHGEVPFIVTRSYERFTFPLDR